MWKTCLEARLKITLPWFKGTLYSGWVSLKHKMCLKYSYKFALCTLYRAAHRPNGICSLCILYTSIFKANFGLFLFSSCTFCQQLKGKVCHSWWWLAIKRDLMKSLNPMTWRKSKAAPSRKSFLISRHFSSSTILEFEFHDECTIMVSSWMKMRNSKQILIMISSEL